jgi:hypothetical protein
VLSYLTAPLPPPAFRVWFLMYMQEEDNLQALSEFASKRFVTMRRDLREIFCVHWLPGNDFCVEVTAGCVSRLFQATFGFLLRRRHLHRSKLIVLFRQLGFTVETKSFPAPGFAVLARVGPVWLEQIPGNGCWNFHETTDAMRVLKKGERGALTENSGVMVSLRGPPRLMHPR